ncbi:TolB family protein [Hahella ganghwensis]|uniref:TolB family protein n=1 Tax=Hahella ganghwensis TaxID=286420 RepID=UPI000369F530|nr:PD40 domain-containing protein [Hahella ganghwensis]
MAINWVPLTCVVVVLLMLQACGSGSTSTVNGELSGHIFIGNRAGPWILDIQSGHYHPIPGAIWERNPHYPGLADFTAFPRSFDGSEYVETVENCYIKFGQDRDCIVFHSKGGKPTDVFALPDISFGPARMSRDGKLVGVVVENRGRKKGGPFFILHIYSRSGKLIKKFDRIEIRRHNFDWLPNNRLIFVSGQSIYVSGSSKPIVTIPAALGQPGEPSANSNGNKIAFTVGEKSSTGILGTIWVIDSNGSGLTQLTEGSGWTRHRTPIWSPDGRWVFVIDQSTIQGKAYVVASNAEKIHLDSNSKAVRPLRSFFKETIHKGSDPIPLSNQFGVRTGSIAWLP